MKFIRVKAVARKEFIHIVRDPRSLGMAIAIPMLLLFLFGYALALDVDRVPLMVWDQSQTPASREFLTYFTGSRYFSLQRYASGYPELERALDANEVLVGLVIPRDFAERARTRAPVRVQAIVDGSDSNTATISMGYLNAISLAYSNQVLLEETRRITGKTPAPPVDLRPRVWFNADLESRNYIIPGLTAVIMMVIAALLTSLTVAKEWEQGTMEQLISTPVKETELVVGKLLPYFAIGMLDVLLAVLMGAYVFEVPLRGSVPLLFGVSAVFLAGALSMGMLISIAAKSQLLASQLAMILTFLPS
nr:ABC transporter permease [Candidatus Hydrogenedentota bacterium]